MESHIKILAWMYIIFGILGLLGAGCLGIILIGSGFLAQDDVAMRILVIVSVVFGLFTLLVSAPGIIAGWGLLRYLQWARVLTIVLGILNLLGFPLGTILGVYTMIVLFDNRSSEFFEKSLLSY